MYLTKWWNISTLNIKCVKFFLLNNVNNFIAVLVMRDEI